MIKIVVTAILIFAFCLAPMSANAAITPTQHECIKKIVIGTLMFGSTNTSVNDTVNAIEDCLK